MIQATRLSTAQRLPASSSRHDANHTQSSGDAGTSSSGVSADTAPPSAGAPFHRPGHLAHSDGRAAVDSAIANDSSGIEAAKSALQSNLKALASDPAAFHQMMQKSFGASYDRSKAEAIREQVLAGDFSWMPDIKVVDESVLQDQSGQQNTGHGLGAYSADNDTIYISSQLLSADPAKALEILTEEVGHALDARLNTRDAAGDEGAIFARLASGEQISNTELAELRAENDSGTIIVDGRAVEVEFGWFSKAVKSITKPFRKLGKAIKKGVSKAWSGLKKGFTKLMQSKLFNTILTIAQFIPIPIVQVAVRVINVIKAAYSVYQGVKHGSVAAVLSGVAGVAGGVGSLGSSLGASANFVNTANRISTAAGHAATGYQVLAKGDFAAAASLASNYFGGDATSTGRAFAGAGHAIRAVDSAQDGNLMGVISSGQAAYGSLTANPDANPDANTDANTDASEVPATRSRSNTESTNPVTSFINSVKANGTYQAIVENVSTIRSVVKSVQDGEYQAGASEFLASYGSDLGLSHSVQGDIKRWAGVMDTVQDTRELFDEGKHPEAIAQAAALLGIPLSETNQLRLNTAFSIGDSVSGQQYSTAARQAAALSIQSGKPELAANFLRLANLLDGNLSAAAA